MTSTPSIPAEDGTIYPTEWQQVSFKEPNTLANKLSFEYRQLTDDTYQVRSPDAMITITKKGFALFTDSRKSRDWNEWLRLNAKSVPREDL